MNNDPFAEIVKLALSVVALIIVTPVIIIWKVVDAIQEANLRRPPPSIPTAALLTEATAQAVFPSPETFFTQFALSYRDNKTEYLPHLNVLTELQDALVYVYEAEVPRVPRNPNSADPVAIARYRDALREYIRLNTAEHVESVMECFKTIVDRVTRALPPHAVQTRSELSEYEETAKFTVPLVDTLDNAAELVSALTLPFFSERYSRFFLPIKEQLDRNLCAISKLPFTEENRTSPKLIMPRSYQGASQEMVSAYFEDTHFSQVFETRLPFLIPKSAWNEHTFILGASGSGKTQLLQSLILDWLKEPDPPSLIIVDSQGDMLNKIERLALFDGVLADRLIIIDPEDDEPPSLNMFDMQTPRLAGYSRNVREQVEASVIELYTYLFGALDSTLTAKQSTAFTYVARLMLSIPDATIHTFRALMEETGKGPSQFAPDIAKLDTTAREFFERQFFSPAFAETRQQVARRLYDFLRVPAFDRIFSAPRNRLDMFSAMQAGKIVLVNTSKSLLKSASPLFGRYMIMQVLAAAYERVAIPEAERKPAYLIVDEAHEYFDKTLEDILTQCRKYRVGLICANQTLDQCSPDIRSTLISNTSIKLMGGLSDRDARALAPDMRTSSDFLTDTQKGEGGATFNCFVRNYTPRGIHLGIGFGLLEAEPTMSAEAHRTLRATNRAAYAHQRLIAMLEPVEPTESAAALPENRPESTPPRSPDIDPAW